MSTQPAVMHFPTKGDEKMRASKLIMISTVAFLMGGTSLAIGQGVAESLQGGNSMQEGSVLSSMQEGSAINQSGARGSDIKGSNPRAAEKPMHRGEASGERGSYLQGSQRGPAMTAERGRASAGDRGLATTAEHRRAIAGERGLVTAAERGQATTGQGAKAPQQIQGQLGPRLRQSFGQAQGGLVYARAGERERNASVELNAQQRERLREIVAARRDIPRVSNLADVRVNAVIPRSVRLAAIPDEVVRIYPRFRRHQAFIYRNEIVVVDPLTSRIVAVLPA